MVDAQPGFLSNILGKRGIARALNQKSYKRIPLPEVKRPDGRHVLPHDRNDTPQSTAIPGQDRRPSASFAIYWPFDILE